jgi:hypothetical protein
VSHQTHALAGCSATLVVSDPWDVATYYPRIRVRIVEVHEWDGVARNAVEDRDAILAEVLDRVLDRGAPVRYLVVDPRNPPYLVAPLVAGKTVTCNAVAVPSSRAAGDYPWGAREWRGGFSVLASVKLD